MDTIRNMFQRFKENAFWKSVAALSTGQIVSLLVNILTIPILSRIYSKEAFGEFAIIVSTAGIIIGFIGLGLGSAIMVPKTNEESEDILVSLFTIQVMITSFLAVVFLVFNDYFSLFNLSIPYYLGILFLFFYILLSSLSSLMAVYMNKLKQNKVLMFNPIIGALSLVVIKIPFGLVGLDSVGLFISTIVASLLINVHLLRVRNPFKRRFSLKKTIHVFKTYRHFVLFQYPANLLNQLAVQFPNQYINSKFGTTGLADLDMSNRVIQQPLSLITSPIQTVYFRVASERYKNGEEIADFTYSFIKKALILGIIPVLLLSTLGEEIFGFVLGVQWKEAGKIAAVLSLSYLFYFTYGCITYARVIMNKQKSNLFSTSLNLVVTVFFILGSYHFFGTYISLIYAVSFSSVMFNVLNIFITLKLMNKHYLRFLFIALLYIFVIFIILIFKYFI